MTSRVRKSLTMALAVFALAANAKPVPDLKFQDMGGHPQKLSSLRGSIAVVNFWATWCGPCREEMPRLSALQQQYSARGVRFIAISADEPKNRSKIAPIIAQGGIQLEIWTGADLFTLDHLNLGNGLPATMVLDNDGTVIGRIEGEARDADVTGYLDWLLSDRHAPAPAPLIKRM